MIGLDRSCSVGERPPAEALRAAVRAVLLVLSLATVLTASPAFAWWNAEWTLRKKITIDTGASGANVIDPIGTTPVLVRLHAGNFRFGSAKDDGSDLRFVAGDDKTPLVHHVEKFDSLLGEALVWVQVPDLKPAAKTDIWLYFSNAKAPNAADPKGTHDGDTVLVYHFADRGTPALDVSAWANSARTIVPGADGAIIGQGARLDGQTPLVIPASPSLAVADGGATTWSAWVKMAAPQPRAILHARQDGANRLLIGLDDGVPFVEVTAAGTTSRTTAVTAVTAATWRHIAVAAGGGQIVLYVDGAPVATLAATLPALSGPIVVGSADLSAASEVQSGTPGDGATPPAAGTFAGATGFVGDIDEMQIHKVARSAGFIKAAAIGQGPDHAKLITFSVDEETGSWLTGYFAIIINSVTLDGWIVIVMCIVLAIISWIVMFEKTMYLNRAAKGNAIFRRHFDEAATDLDGLLRIDEQEEIAFARDVNAKETTAIRRSPLFRLFHLGAREIRNRLSGAGGMQSLSPQAIAAIRAVLDAGYIREVQKLNKSIVLLTIAISGGPFLGLLGTVIGVMITFAVIAASGDVNVNAIAPGVAAALVATVAGLAAAIPALFGYNYLVTRIKDATTEMQVFIDEFVTKMDESFHASAERSVKVAAE